MNNATCLPGLSGDRKYAIALSVETCQFVQPDKDTGETACQQSASLLAS